MATTGIIEKKPQSYKIFAMRGEMHLVEVEGYQVTLPGYETVEAFVARNPNDYDRWHVFSKATGLCISAGGIPHTSTRPAAVRKAIENLNHAGLERTLECIAEAKPEFERACSQE
jgi:hypothetical protein